MKKKKPHGLNSTHFTKGGNYWPVTACGKATWQVKTTRVSANTTCSNCLRAMLVYGKHTSALKTISEEK